MSEPKLLSLDQISPTLMQAGEIVYEWDLISDALMWSEGADSLLEAEWSALSTGQAYALLVNPDSPNTRYDAIFNAPVKDNGRGVPYTAEYRLQGSKDRLWIHDTGIWHSNERGQPVLARGIVRIFPDNPQNFRGGQLSPFDPLTGQLNAIRLFDRLENAIQLAEYNQTSAGFLLAAVNNLSIINEAYGFEAADRVIAAVGQKLSANLRGRDTVGRYSGNKFGIVLPGCDDKEMKIASERLIDAIQSEPMRLDHGQINIALSIGGVIVPRYARNARQAMLHAHEALHRVKGQRGTAYANFTQSSAAIAKRQENLKIADEIISALNDHRVSIHFQPVVRAATEEVGFHECLLKIRDEKGQVHSAQSYVEAAEKLDLIHLIDCRVLELACGALFRDRDAQLSINISARTANDPDWMMLLAALRRANGSFDGRLIIEITETAAMQDIEDADRFVSILQDMGCRVAIDDFGARYTSFRHLHRLRPDLIKIDGAFVQNLHASPENQVFCKALIDIAKAFDIEIVAEYVEDTRDAAILKGWNVDYMQGFLYGRAMPTIKEGVTGADAHRKTA